jgi:hypothetical protein
MIQVTATMRILVAIEPVDLRKYAPSMNVRSEPVGSRKNGSLYGICTAHKGDVPLRSKQGE